MPYTENSLMKGNPLYRDIPYVYIYIYIQGKLYREILYKGKPRIQRHL